MTVWLAMLSSCHCGIQTFPSKKGTADNSKKSMYALWALSWEPLSAQAACIAALDSVQRALFVLILQASITQ